MRRLRETLVLFLLTLPAMAYAEDTPPDPSKLITSAVIQDVREWLSNPIMELSVKSQNQKRGSLSQTDIDKLDQQWRAEREITDQPLISATLSAPLSIYLLRVQANSVGLYRELFVMDANGLNVGQSAITGDYWQGDEAKFQKTFPVGSDAVFIDEPEWDDDFKIWRAQLNLTLADKTTGEPMGSATIEFNLTELQRRQELAS